VVTGTGGGPNFGGGPTFSGVGAGRCPTKQFYQNLPSLKRPSSCAPACAALRTYALEHEARSGSGTREGGSPPALPRPVRRGARKVHPTHAHAQHACGDAWAGWGAKRGCERCETAGQRSEGPSCRRPAPAPTEFPCPLPLFMSSPYRRSCRRPKPNASRKRCKGVGGWAKPPPSGHVLQDH
jgi:hypothetical protein